MDNLKDMLVKEQERLEQILHKTEKRLQDAPQGTLHLSKCKNSIQYYRYMPADESNGTYIPKSDIEQIHSLAQKSYDQKIQKLAGKRLSQIKKITRDYDNNEIENVYLNLHEERKKLVEPVELPWEQQLEQWNAKEYKQKEFQEGTAVILTEKGERVRSKSEKILADYFYRNGIPYKYEKPLYLKGLGIVHPDFTFLSGKTKQEIYWEHDGRMDDGVYVQNAIRKIHAYEANGIYPGENLILTFETEKLVLDIRIVKRLVERYLL